jgi:transposase
MTTYSDKEILVLSKQEKNVNNKIPLLALDTFLQSNNRSEVARRLNVSSRSLNDWVSSFLDLRITGLEDKPRLGKKSRLTIKQKDQVCQFVTNVTQSKKVAA